MGPREGQVNGQGRGAGVNALVWAGLLALCPGPARAALANDPIQSFEAGRLVVLSALAAGAVALAIAAALWALAEQRTARRLARAVRANAAHARAAMSERDALLG